MSDETPREAAGLPPDLAALERRVEADAALWLARLPATARLDEHARALPARLAAARAPTAADTPIQRTTTITTPAKEPSMRIHTPTRPRSLLAATAALVVVGAIAALLISLGARQQSPASGGPTPTASRAQPGPQASHIASIVTATGVGAENKPVHVTSTFQRGQTIYVVMQTRGVPIGERHILSISWLLNGQPLDVPPEVVTQTSIKFDSSLYFALKYPEAGQGAAKVYWDLPTSDAHSPEDLLAWTISFTVADGDTPTPAPGDTPTPHPTPTPPNETPGPTPSGTPIPPTPTIGGPSAMPTLPPPR